MTDAPGTGKLRSGFTTGACAAAAARAACAALRAGEPADSIPVLFPDSSVKIFPVKVSLCENSATAAVIKDAGDDPDVTHGAEITVTVSAGDGPKDSDHIQPCGKGRVIIRGGKGVGLVTRPGLAVPPGKCAVNPGPQKMIAENLRAAGFGADAGETVLVEISVPEGENLAKKTLNPTLGVTGGISILGVSGIVVPYSNEAYVETIRLRVGMAAEEGGSLVALSTGGRTEAALLRDAPGLGSARVIRIADYIGEALRAAEKARVKHLIIGCMPGKLYKYALGLDNTHAHKTKLSPELLTSLAAGRGLPPETLRRLESCDTVGEAASFLPPEDYSAILRGLGDMAMAFFRRTAPGVPVMELLVYDSGGQPLFSKKDERA